MPAPRRSSARGDRRRREILEAALAEIRAQAVADVQLSAIAARTGLRASHLLYYFGSRDEVLIAAVALAEQRLATGRPERLRRIADGTERLAAYVGTYLPDDRHDPIWKLWIEGWLRSPSRAEFTTVGRVADQRWMADLVECLEHAEADGATLPEPAAGYARRLLFVLDGLAIHVLADHIGAEEAVAHAMFWLSATITPGHSSRGEGASMSGDPYGGRQPTSHEQRAGAPWDASYTDGPAPWDVGGPQPAIVRLAEEGAFTGAVLDAGCGTGDNALHIAALGLPVLGVDVAGTALAMARAKAAERGLDAEFEVADALHLDRLGRVFDTVLDSGLFHALDGDERREYAASLATVTRPGAKLYLLCFGDAGPGAPGPHPVTEEEVRATFTGGGWSVASVSPERILAGFAPQGAPAWLARIERVSAATR